MRDVREDRPADRACRPNAFGERLRLLAQHKFHVGQAVDTRLREIKRRLHVAEQRSVRRERQVERHRVRHIHAGFVVAKLLRQETPRRRQRFSMP